VKRSFPGVAFARETTLAARRPARGHAVWPERCLFLIDFPQPRRLSMALDRTEFCSDHADFHCSARMYRRALLSPKPPANRPGCCEITMNRVVLERKFLNLCRARGPDWIESVLRPLRLPGARVSVRDIPLDALQAAVRVFGRRWYQML
jgi:hypothetical protein